MAERRGTKGLELWCKKVTQGYPGVQVDNMTSSWRDGLAFCAIIHHFRPDLIDFAKLNKNDIHKNNELAFRVAEQYLGVPALLEAQDMVTYEVPDRLSILTYLSQFYQAFAVSKDSPSRLIPKRSVTFSGKHSSDAEPPTKMALKNGGAVVGLPRREKCAKCGLPVFIAERINVGKQLYHTSCFSCARCRSQLTLANYYETETKNQFCCEICPDEMTNNNNNINDASPVEPDKSEIVNQSLCDEEKSANLGQDEYSTMFETALEEISSLTSDNSVMGVTARSHFMNTQFGLEDEEEEEENKPPELPSSKPPDKMVTDISENNLPQNESEMVTECDDSGLPQNSQSLEFSVDKQVDGDIKNTSLVQSRMKFFEERESPVPSRTSDVKTFTNRVSRDANKNSINEVNVNQDLIDNVVEVPKVENISEIQIVEESENVEKVVNSVLTEESDLRENTHESLLVCANVPEASPSIPDTLKSSLEIIVEPVRSAEVTTYQTTCAINENGVIINKELDIIDSATIVDNTATIEDSPTKENVKSVVVDESKENDESVLIIDSNENDKTVLILDSKENDGSAFIVESKEDDESVLIVDSSENDESVLIHESKENDKHVLIYETKPAEELYPEDLNPFDDDTGEEATRKVGYEKSLNPFGDDDEDDETTAELIVPPTPRLRKVKLYSEDINVSTEVTVDPKNPLVEVLVKRQPTPRTDVPKISLNPFGSDDDEEEEAHQLKPVATPRKRYGATTPEPRPRTSGQSISTTFGSSTSISSNASSAPSLRKKKAAPKPPIPFGNQESPLNSLNSSPSTSVQHSPSRPRKAKRAPLPPNTSTPTVRRSLRVSLSPIFPNDPAPEAINKLLLGTDIANADNKHAPLSSASSVDSGEYEKEKVVKDELNRNRQSQTIDTLSTPNKSTYGKWKRRKGQAPSRPIPQKRTIKSLPVVEVRRELDTIELQLTGLQRQGVRLEQIIRDQCEGPEADPDSAISIEAEDLILQLFEVVNEKNELCRRQSELMYLQRQQRLEEEHAEVEYQIRCLMVQPEINKTDSDKAREEELINRLVEIVERRSEIIECLELDRVREAEEDDSIGNSMNSYALKRDEGTKLDDSSSKKKRKKRFKLKVLKKVDADKDVDESEQSTGSASKSKKKFHLF